jgi:hypothetical protein
MPAIFHYCELKFISYSNEGTPRQPAHVHAEKEDTEATFWLFPKVRVAYNDGYNARARSRRDKSRSDRQGME